MVAVFFAALAHIGYGVGDVFATFATRKLGSWSTSFWMSVFGLFIFAAGMAFFWEDLAGATLEIVSLNIILAILLSLSFLSFMQALRIGNAPLVGTIAGSFPAVSIIVAVLFFSERPNLLQVTTMLAVFVGIILSSVDIKEIKRRAGRFDKAILLAIFTMLGWGIYFSVIRIPINHYDWFWAQQISTITGVVFFFLLGRKQISIADIRSKDSFKYIFVAAFLTYGGTFSFNYALSVGDTSIVAPIAGSYPALFAYLSYRVFKETLTFQKKIGIVVTLLGVISLAIASS